MGRVLSIDYGKKRIGLALSDPLKIIASPLKTLQAGKDNIALLEKEIGAHDIETIVMGLPLHLSNEESELSTLVRQVAAELEKKVNLPIILWDERLTSKQVEKLMIEDNVKRKKRTEHLDTLSATLILQSYLDSL